MTVSGRRKIEQIQQTEARFVASPCANCKQQLSQLVRYHTPRVEVVGVHALLSRAIVLERRPLHRPHATGEAAVPQLRKDLLASAASLRTIHVDRPEAEQPRLLLHDVEWEAARLLDGSKTPAQVVAELRRLGIPATLNQVNAFVRELQGAGLLTDRAATDEAALCAGTEATGSGPLRTAAGPDERWLHEAAVRLKARGMRQEAQAYLQALLQVNAGNAAAQAMLADLEAQEQQHDADNWPVTAGIAASAPPSGVAAPPAAGGGMTLEARSGPGKASLWRLPGYLGMLNVALLATLSTFFVAAGIGQEKWLTAAAPPSAPRHLQYRTPQPSPQVTFVPTSLRPWKSTPVLVPRAGVVARLYVANGNQVEAGQELALIMPQERYQEWTAVLAALRPDDFRRSRRRQSRQELLRTRKKLIKLAKNLQARLVLALRPGVAKLGEISAGDTVSAGQTLLFLLDTTTLLAQVPDSALSFGQRPLLCRAESLDRELSVPCWLRMELPSDPTATGPRVVIDNREGLVPADARLRIVLRQPSYESAHSALKPPEIRSP